MAAQEASETQLLRAWGRNGDQAALEELTRRVQHRLRRIARIYLSRERAGHTLQPTALVNEAFVRLLQGAPIAWVDRAHFLGIAARLMRQVLVDSARARGYQKRGGGLARVTLDAAMLRSPEKSIDMLALDEALSGLAEVDSRKARVIELRFFGGLSVEETAAVLAVSPDTVKRDWRLAKLWLLRSINERT